MLRLSPLWIALACAINTHSTALAAPGIWRCGNNYSDIPCEGGKQVDTQAPPSAQDRKRRDEDTLRDQAAAERMQRERLELDAQPRRAAVISAPARETPAAKPQAGLLKSNKKKKKPDAFVASYTDPNAKPAGKKNK